MTVNGATGKPRAGQVLGASVEKSHPKTFDSGAERRDNVAQSLRKVYQATVAENIPDEMLDLLNKLG